MSIFINQKLLFTFFCVLVLFENYIVPANSEGYRSFKKPKKYNKHVNEVGADQKESLLDLYDKNGIMGLSYPPELSDYFSLEQPENSLKRFNDHQPRGIDNFSYPAKISSIDYSLLSLNAKNQVLDSNNVEFSPAPDYPGSVAFACFRGARQMRVNLLGFKINSDGSYMINPGPEKRQCVIKCNTNNSECLKHEECIQPGNIALFNGELAKLKETGCGVPWYKTEYYVSKFPMLFEAAYSRPFGYFMPSAIDRLPLDTGRPRGSILMAVPREKEVVSKEMSRLHQEYRQTGKKNLYGAAVKSHIMDFENKLREVCATLNEPIASLPDGIVARSFVYDTIHVPENWVLTRRGRFFLSKGENLKDAFDLCYDNYRVSLYHIEYLLRVIGGASYEKNSHITMNGVPNNSKCLESAMNDQSIRHSLAAAFKTLKDESIKYMGFLNVDQAQLDKMKAFSDPDFDPSGDMTNNHGLGFLKELRMANRMAANTVILEYGSIVQEAQLIEDGFYLDYHLVKNLSYRVRFMSWVLGSIESISMKYLRHFWYPNALAETDLNKLIRESGNDINYINQKAVIIEELFKEIEKVWRSISAKWDDEAIQRLVEVQGFTKKPYSSRKMSLLIKKVREKFQNAQSLGSAAGADQCQVDNLCYFDPKGPLPQGVSIFTSGSHNDQAGEPRYVCDCGGNSAFYLKSSNGQAWWAMELAHPELVSAIEIVTPPDSELYNIDVSMSKTPLDAVWSKETHKFDGIIFKSETKVADPSVEPSENMKCSTDAQTTQMAGTTRRYECSFTRSKYVYVRSNTNFLSLANVRVVSGGLNGKSNCPNGFETAFVKRVCPISGKILSETDEQKCGKFCNSKRDCPRDNECLTPSSKCEQGQIKTQFQVVNLKLKKDPPASLCMTPCYIDKQKRIKECDQSIGQKCLFQNELNKIMSLDGNELNEHTYVTGKSLSDEMTCGIPIQNQRKVRCTSKLSKCHEDAVCLEEEDWSYSCKCKPGYIGNGIKTLRDKGLSYGTGCEDEDECLNSPCDPNATCANTPGSFVCECNSGYEGDGFTCKAENPCLLTNSEGGSGPCGPDAICEMRSGDLKCRCEGPHRENSSDTHCREVDHCAAGYCDEHAICAPVSMDWPTCQCNLGFSGNGINGNCEDIDECLDQNGGCSDTEDCVNQIGKAPICNCKPGYERRGAQCIVIDRCKNPNSCGENMTCTNQINMDPICECKIGYEKVGNDCIVIDKCKTMNGGCSENATCQNNVADSPTCTCKLFYKGDGITCEDIDECTEVPNACGPNSRCENKIGAEHVCTCKMGFVGDGKSCTDKCAINNGECSANADCEQQSDSEPKCVCKYGYTGDGKNCEDIDECMMNNGGCHENAICFNMEGKEAACECKDGYKGDGKNCAGIDKCQSNNGGCDKNADCENIIGQEPNCSCKSGYTGDGKNCEDYDECEQDNGGCGPNADCINQIGKNPICKCKEGFRGGSGTDCEAENKCAKDNGGCNQQAKCENQAGQDPKCTCLDGFTGDGKDCEDIDECSESNGGCDKNAICTNRVGKLPICQCKSGYTGDGIDCKDINECLVDNGGCHKNADCENVEGGERVCKCKPFFKGNGITCEDINECLANNGGCHMDAVCTNQIGKEPLCECKSGFQGDGKQCDVVDQCQENNGGCDFNARCENKAQSSEPNCVCNKFYKGDGKHCEDIDECLTNNGECHIEAKCTNQEGAEPICKCNPGYTGDGKDCQEYDECQAMNCGVNAFCKNQPGVGPVCLCNPFFTGDGMHCDDIDECSANNGSCHEMAVCVNQIGAEPICRCKDGYSGDGINCDDIDECLDNNGGCSKDATCTNQIGMIPDCKCKSGFTGDGRDCSDINECFMANGGCHKNAKCTNVIGGDPECACNAGYTGDGKICEDIDECADQNGGCDTNADCTNQEGKGPICQCKQWFTGDGRTCIGIDKCQTSLNDCHSHSNCINQVGGDFTCECMDGYTGDGRNCDDVDECLENNGGCSAEAFCINQEGIPPICECKNGYTGDGKSCIDIDECAQGLNPCDKNSVCQNMIGQDPVCTCNAGYTGDGKTCRAINPCDDLTHNCGDLATCEYTNEEKTNYKCVCQKGYTGKGTTQENEGCNDIDECLVDNGSCHPDAHCINTEGGFKCECKKGYNGNGFFCSKTITENRNIKAYERKEESSSSFPFVAVAGGGVAAVVAVAGATLLYRGVQTPPMGPSDFYYGGDNVQLLNESEVNQVDFEGTTVKMDLVEDGDQLD